jgi:hypothetical protein
MFPTEGYSLDAKDHWALCLSNLQRLNAGIDRYLSEHLKCPPVGEPLNLQEIARHDSKLQLLLLVLMHR